MKSPRGSDLGCKIIHITVTISASIYAGIHIRYTLELYNDTSYNKGNKNFTTWSKTVTCITM